MNSPSIMRVSRIAAHLSVGDVIERFGGEGADGVIKRISLVSGKAKAMKVTFEGGGTLEYPNAYEGRATVAINVSGAHKSTWGRVYSGCTVREADEKPKYVVEVESTPEGKPGRKFTFDTGVTVTRLESAPVEILAWKREPNPGEVQEQENISKTVISPRTVEHLNTGDVVASKDGVHSQKTIQQIHRCGSYIRLFFAEGGCTDYPDSSLREDVILDASSMITSTWSEVRRGDCVAEFVDETPRYVVEVQPGEVFGSQVYVTFDMGGASKSKGDTVFIFGRAESGEGDTTSRQTLSVIDLLGELEEDEIDGDYSDDEQPKRIEVYSFLATERSATTLELLRELIDKNPDFAHSQDVREMAQREWNNYKNLMEAAGFE